MQKKVTLIFAVLLVPLISIGSNFSNNRISAASSWAQSNWSGGSGQNNWVDATKFSTSNNINFSTPGSINLNTQNWLNNSWQYRQKITFDNSGQATNLVNFPALIVLNSGRIDYTKTQNAGQDIRFTDSDGTSLLSYEIENWDEAGNSNVWVKVPQIDASSTTDFIYVYYGNSGAVDAQNPTNVWTDNYAVWHLDESSTNTIGEFEDSSGNGNPGQGFGLPDQVSGQIVNSQDFDGNDFIGTGTDPSLEVQEHTLSAWINPTDLNDNTKTFIIASKSDSIFLSGIEWGIRDNQLAFAYNDGGIQGWFTSTFPSQILTGSWYKVDLVWDQTNGQASFYVNGQFINSVATPTNNVVYSSDIFRIGDQNENRRFKGRIDELRIASNTKSADWIAANYKSETDTFNSFTTEESQVAISGTLTSSIYDTGFSAQFDDITFTGTFPLNTTTVIKVRSGNQSNLSDASSFAACSAIITSPSDLSSYNCVDTGDRYIQYQVEFTSDQLLFTSPEINSIEIAYSEYIAPAPPPSNTLTIGSIYYIYSGGNAIYIRWFTNEASSSRVEYGLTSAYGKTTNEFDTAPNVTSHLIYISDLTPCTLYNFRVISKKGSDEAISGNNLFKTDGCGSTLAPSQPPVSTPVSFINNGKPVTVPVSGEVEGYKLTVSVVDVDNKVVKGANVSLFSIERSGVTNEKGEVVFEGVEAGEHTLKVTYADASGEQKVTIDGDKKEINIIIKLESTPSPVIYILIGIIAILLILLFFKSRKKAN